MNNLYAMRQQPPPAKPQELDGLSVLASLVKLLSDPKSAQRVTEYHAAAKAHHDEAERAKSEQTKLLGIKVTTEQECDDARGKCADDIRQMKGAYDAQVADREQKLSEREAAVAKKEAKAEETLKAAQEMQRRWQTKLAAFETAA
jgi:hypothetical protein